MPYPNGATKSFTAQPRFKGGVGVRTLTGAVTCDNTTETFAFWDPGGSSRDITLPPEETSDGLFMFFKNTADAAENLVLKDDAAATIVTINQSEWAILACNGSAWYSIPLSGFADILASANTWTLRQTFSGGITPTDFVFAAATELTIASGAIAATRGFHTVDTEADAASDDLDDITGGTAGELLVIKPENGARTVVLRHAIGANKIATPGGIAISLAEPTDWALLISDGTQWAVIGSSALVDTAAAIVAANTDATIPGDFRQGTAASGTWTLTRQGTALYRLRRTAAAAIEVFGQCFYPRGRTTASKGFRVTGFKLVYAVSTADVDDVSVAGAVLLTPATGSAPAAATALGAVTYDAAHDTAAERKAVGSHTMQGTFATPLWLNAEPLVVELAITVEGSATGVVDLIGVELLGTEALIDTTS